MTDVTTDVPLHTLPPLWRGRLDIGEHSLRVRLNLPTKPDGPMTLDLVDSGVVSIPVTDVHWDGTRLEGSSSSGPLQLRLEGDELHGHQRLTAGDAQLHLSSAEDAYLADVTPRLTDGRPARDFVPSPVAELPGDWPVATKPAEGLDEAPLLDLGQRIVDGAYSLVDDVLIAQHGRLVFEEYFYGRRPGLLHTIQSCTKSVTALVVGTVVDAGELDLDAPVWRYFPDRGESRWVREQYDATVRDLLAMAVGLVWEEEVAYTDPRNDNTAMNLSGDWIGYVLDRPRQPDWPRNRWVYQSGLTLMLGELVRGATGRSVVDVARDRLFGPLGITDFNWYADPDGTVHTGGGLALRPRDLLRLGQLVLQQGEWDGRRVLSREWVEQVSTEQSTDGTTSYSFQWFLGSPDIDGRIERTVSASGYGGQALHVLPELDAVVVSNATDYFGDGAYGQILVHHAIPALRGQG